MRPPLRYAAVTDSIRATRSKSLLEVGTWNGDRASAMVAAAYAIAGPVRYVGFDLFEGMNPAMAKEEFNAKTPTAEAAVRAKLEGLKAKHKSFSFDLWKGNTRETLPRFLSQSGAGSVDFVWLDGGHSVETIDSDWKNCRRAVRPSGVVLLDDYYSEVAPAFLEKFGCNKLVDRLKTEGCNVSVLPVKDPVVGGGLVQIVRVFL